MSVSTMTTLASVPVKGDDLQLEPDAATELHRFLILKEAVLEPNSILAGRSVGHRW